MNKYKELEKRVADLEQDSEDWAEGFKTTNELLDYMLHDIDLSHKRIDNLVDLLESIRFDEVDPLECVDPTDPFTSSIVREDYDTEFGIMNKITFTVNISMDDPRYSEIVEDLHKLKTKYQLYQVK